MRTRTVATVLLVVGLLLAGCTAPSTGSKTEKVDVPIPTERSADIKLDMRSGDIKLAGAAAGLLEGTLAYDGADPKPVVTTGSRESTAGKVVTVSIEQPRTAQSVAGSRRLWDLRLNGGLPTNVDVTSASGDLDLDLKLADPKDLDITSSSGDVQIELGGPHPSLSRVAVKGTSGDVRVDANGEYPALEGFTVDSSSGSVSVDLSGIWRKTFTAEVAASSGDVTIVAPRDVNVRVLNAPASGSVTAEGFAQSRNGDARSWIREADKPSGFTLTVALRIASGNLTLKVPEKK